MSTTIDTNIVEMKFDNKQFEEGCKQSMSTLDKLKAKINNTSGDGLKDLGKAANNIDLSNLEKTMDAVNKKFSVLGVVGATIIQDLTRSAINMAKNVITAVPNIIKEKGWSRAMNIEKAKFQLEGLHVAWEQISGDIDYAVSGTAYGLDAAANAASQLVASGVQVGDSMKAALRGISGVAAMTQSNYEEIAPIFTTIAGQGKVMTMQLRQIENRGLNAAATLADFFNGVNDGSIEASDSVKAAVQSVSNGLKIGEADIREFVTQGEIGFDIFSAAMDNAFGQHAKDANKTFEGVMKNIKSALGRIGADFYTPILKEEGPIVKFLQQVRNRIDDIRKTLQPAVSVWEQFLTIEGTRLTSFMKNLDVSFFSNIAQAGINIFNTFYVVGQTIRRALSDVLSFSGNKGIASLTKSFADFTKTLIPTQKTANKLRDTFRGLFSAVNIVVTVISRLVGAIFGLTPATGGLGDSILTVTATIGNLITYFAIWIDQNDIITPLLQGVTIAIKLMIVALAAAVTNIINFVSWIKQLPITQRIIDGLGDALYLLAGAIAIIVTKVKELIGAIKSGHLDQLGIIGNAIIFVKDGVLMLVNAISQLGFVQTIIEAVAAAFDKVREAADELFGKNATTKISEEVVTINDAMVPLAGELTEVSIAAENTADSADQMAGGLSGVTAAVDAFARSLPIGKIVMLAFAASFAYALWKIGDAMQNFGKGVKLAGGFLNNLQQRGFVGLIFGTQQYSRTPNHILDIAIAIGVLAASITALTKINTDKLNEAVVVLGKLALGYTGVLVVLGALDKWLGFAGAVDYIGVAMLEVASGIAVLAGALSLLTHIDLTKVDKTMEIMATMAVGLTAMAVVMGKFGGSFAKMGTSILAIGASMMVLVKAFEALNAIKANDTLGDLVKKLGAVGVLALEMIGIAKLCDMLGGKSFMRLAISTAGLALAMQIFVSMVDKLPKDFTKKVVEKIKEIAEGLKDVVKSIATAISAFASIAALVAGAIVIMALISKGTRVLVFSIGNMFESLSKIRKHQDDHKKALNTLAMSALVSSIAGAVALLAGVVIILTKADLAKNKEAFDAGMAAMTAILIAMSAMIFEVGIALKGIKGAGSAMLGSVLMLATVFASTVGIAVWIYSVFAQNKTILEKVGEIAVAVVSLGIVLASLYAITSAMSKLKNIKFDKTTTTGIIAMISSIAVIAASVISLAYMMSRGQTQLLAVIGAFGLLGAAMFGMYELIKGLSKLDQTNFKPSTFKVILGMVAAIGTIAVSLSLLTNTMDKLSDIGKLAASTVALVGVMLALAGCLKIMSTIKYNKQQMDATKGMVVMLISITGSLALLMHMMDDIGDIAKLGAAALSLAGVFAAFAGMTRVLLNGKFSKNIFKEFLAMLIPLASITVALIALSQFGGEWPKILASAFAMSAVFATFAAMTLVLSKATYSPDIWHAFIGIAGEAVAIAFSLSLLAGFEWQKLIGAAFSMSIVFAAFAGMTILLSKAQNMLTGMVAMIGIAASAVIVAKSLSMLAGYDWEHIKAAMAGMVIVIGVFGGLAIILSKIPAALTGMIAMIGLSAAAVIVAVSLSMVAQYDWQHILAAALGIVGVMGAFALISGIAGAIPTVYGGMVAMIGISAAAVLIGFSLSMVAQYDWQNILAAAGAMAGVMAIFSVIAVILGALIPVAAPGAAALIAIGGAAVIFATSLLIASTAFMTFSTALNTMLPVVSAFIQNVVPYQEQLLSTAGGLAALAGSLVILGIAGVALLPGSPGLIAAAVGLTALVPACESAQNVDILSIAKGLAALVIPGIAMGLVGPALTIAAAGMAVCAIAMTAFAAALKAISSAFQPAMKALNGIGKKVDEAKKWGSDLVNNFVNGIKSNISKLKNTIVNMAKLIRSYIHFTTPEKGPLSDADTYGGDFIDVLCDGITESIPELEGVMDKLGGIMEGSLEDIDLSSIGDQLGIDLGSGTFDSLMPYINQIKNQIAGIQNQVHNGYGQVSKGGSVYRGAAGESLLTQRLRAERKAAQETTPVIDDYTKSVGSAGGGSSKAAKEVKDLSDAFKTVERGTKVNLGNMINSLKENYIETARWAQDMKDLMGKGYDKAITDWVMKMGVGGHETVKALKNGSAEEVAGLNAAMKAYLTLDEKAEEYILGKYDSLGGLIGQVLDDSVMTWSSKLAETIQNAVDPFKEFDDKTELSSEKMLENMRSQITGITQWSDNVTSLFGRVPESLIQYFSELGPASYEEVNAMAHMTEDQLAEAVSLWEQQLALGQTLAIQQAQKYKEVGMSVSQGLEDGIDFDKAREDGVQLANEVIDGSTSKDGFDINSPSKKFLSIGQSVDEGLDKGIALKGHTPVNQIIIVCTNVINEAQRIVNWEAGNTIGSNLAEGMKNGIEGTADSVVTAIGSLCSRLIEKANNVLDERSPSHVFEKIGKFVDLGMAKGIDLSANTVYTSIDDMASSTIDRMSLVIAQISENLNNEFDGLSPVITPVMDLTELQNGKNYMNSMFNNSAYRMASSIASDYSNARTDSSTPILPNNSDVVSAINDLRSDLNSMTEQITNMQVMLDGQTLVGELTPAIDSALGTNAMRVGRGN